MKFVAKMLKVADVQNASTVAGPGGRRVVVILLDQNVPRKNAYGRCTENNTGSEEGE